MGENSSSCFNEDTVDYFEARYKFTKMQWTEFQSGRLSKDQVPLKPPGPDSLCNFFATYPLDQVPIVGLAHAPPVPRDLNLV